MALNRNNYLRWVGTFTKRPYGFILGVPTVALYGNMNSVDIDIFSLSSATLGINEASLRITGIVDGSSNPVVLYQDCDYDGAGNLTVYRPIDITLTHFFIEGYFLDNSGNETSPNPVMLARINVSAIFVEWLTYPASVTCSLDSFGNNTGYKEWSQLELYNTGTGLPIVPSTLKPNIPSDPDYIYPLLDIILCPSDYIGTTGYAPLTISNFSYNSLNPVNDFITITQIQLYNATAGPGGTPVLLTINCEILKDHSQRFNIPANIVWGVTITFAVNPGGDMVTAPYQVYWKSQVNGVADNFPTGGPNPVINTPPMGPNNITLSFPLGATIFCQ